MAHVFISYHHDDFDFAVNLRRELKSAGFGTWMDDEGIYAGEDWRQEIDRAIHESFALIVILSPKATESEYVTYEWSFALGAEIKVIPILFRQGAKLHPRLTALQYEDFTNRLSRPWDRLLARVRQIGKQPAATPKPAQQTSTIQVPDDVPAPIRNAINALDSTNPIQRSEGIQALINMKRPDADEALAVALGHAYLDVSTHAALALAQQKDYRATPVLIGLLSNPEHFGRGAAVEALGLLGDISALPALLTILHVPVPPEQPGIDFQEQVIRTLISFGKPAVSGLIEILGDATLGRIHKPVIEALGKIGDPDAISPLAARLEVKPHRYRLMFGSDQSFTAAEALERIGTPEALAAVEEWRKTQQKP